MGKLVVFWSPYEGHAKVTSVLCAVAGGFGIKYPQISVAISNAEHNAIDLAEKLDSQTVSDRKKEIYGNLGIAALKVNCRQAVLSAEKIKRCAIPLRMKSLYLYPNVGGEGEGDELAFLLLTEHLKKEFDAVFLDLEGGKTKGAFRYMEVADYVVVVLPQEPSYVEHFLDEQEEILAGKEYGIILGGYLKASKYNERYYTRKKKGKAIMGAIPMNTGFFDSMAEGKTLDFFLKNQMAIKKEENHEFIFQAKKAAEQIEKRVFLSGTSK